MPGEWKASSRIPICKNEPGSALIEHMYSCTTGLCGSKPMNPQSRELGELIKDHLGNALAVSSCESCYYDHLEGGHGTIENCAKISSVLIDVGVALVLPLAIVI